VDALSILIQNHLLLYTWIVTLFREGRTFFCLKEEALPAG